MDAAKPLPPERLRRRCDPARFAFETTAGLEPLPEPLGQARALEALRFGTSIRRDGFHVFATGPEDSESRRVVLALLGARAKAEPVPSDACYVNDFGSPYRPRLLELPPGKGRDLRRDMEALVDELRRLIPAVLDGDEQRHRKDALAEEFKDRHEKAIGELRTEAEKRGVALLRTPMGFGFAPMKDGTVVTTEQYEALPEAERTRLQDEMSALQDRLREFLARLPALEKELRERMKKLLREATSEAIDPPIDELTRRYAALPAVVAHLEAVRKDVLENADDLRRALDETPPVPNPFTLEHGRAEAATFRRYGVNVLVDHGADVGAPVVHERHPTFTNLLGRVDHLAQFGALLTDFQLVRPGALHRANGGYLVLDVHDLLMQPYAWEGLKRALKTEEIRIESLGQALSLVSTVSLEPEPVPLRVKVVLLGERYLHHLLDVLDPDFRTLFKVTADFEDDLDRTDENDALYARAVGEIARHAGLRPLDRGGVAALIEQSARAAGDSGKLCTRLGTAADLLREADHRAGAAGAPAIRAEDVDGAVEAQERREGRVRERVLEEIRRGTYLIDTAGARAGQINGLSVSQVGHLAFGRPTRITARVRLGKGEVVDIEREVELGGPIHSKGVMILSGFLGSRYAKDHPLSLSATLVFEQSYGGVEGDSASAAELCALLSAIADVPLRQALAVTGSVNQYGELQAVGGLDEKIEGFFDVCRARGLDGSQGVVLPSSNVRHLMLRRDVVEAAAAGKFHVYAVDTVDQVMELLTGVEAGERNWEAKFPEGSINARVEARLVAMAAKRASFGSGADGGKRGAP